MSATRGLYPLFACLFFTAAARFSGFAQSTTLLRGTVTDPQGGVITSAVVTLSNAGTGFNRSAHDRPTRRISVRPGCAGHLQDRGGNGRFHQIDSHRRAVAGEHSHHARPSHGTRQDHRYCQRDRGSFQPSTPWTLRWATHFRNSRSANFLSRPGTWSNCSACSRA